jgi:hypothetical protein
MGASVPGSDLPAQRVGPLADNVSPFALPVSGTVPATMAAEDVSPDWWPS